MGIFPPYSLTPGGVTSPSDNTFRPENSIYVAMNGSDSNSGGPLSPVRNIQTAINRASSGWCVRVNAGNYTENLTLKSGLSLITEPQYITTVTGNHTGSPSGGLTVITNFNVRSSSGNTITVAGSSAVNVQLINTQITAANGHAILYTNTNASSKLRFDASSNIYVSQSGALARGIHCSATAQGNIVANLLTVGLNNLDNVAISLNGNVTMTHDQDVVNGQVVVAGAASYYPSELKMTTNTVPVLNTTSTGYCVLAGVTLISSAATIVTGTGLFVWGFVLFGGAGHEAATTLNGGLGPLSPTLGALRLQRSTLLPAANIASGNCDGLFEPTSTGLYYTIGTTRYKVSMTPA